MIGSGIRGGFKNDHSRRGRAIDAVDGKDKVHPCPTISAACELTGMSAPTIKAAIEDGVPRHARGSADLWTFRFADDAEKPAAVEKSKPAHLITLRPAAGACTGGGGEGPSLAGALAAVASMAAGIGGLVLSNVSIVAGDGRVELKIEKLEIVRA